MTPDELRKIGEAFLPDHSKDRWRREIVRITNRTERAVRYWEVRGIPINEQRILREEYDKQMKRTKRLKGSNSP